MCLVCEGSAEIFAARFLILDRYRSWMGGRSVPIILSAVRCSLTLSCLVADPYQMVIEEQSTDWMMAV